MIGKDAIGRLQGAHVVGSDGHRLGTVGETFLSEDDVPEWVTVRTGLFGRRESFVPLEDAQLDGDILRIPYDKAKVKDAPHYDPESAPTEEEEIDLHLYYGRPRTSGTRLTRHEDMTADTAAMAAEGTAATGSPATGSPAMGAHGSGASAADPTVQDQMGEADELPEDRPKSAEPQIPQDQPHFEAEGVLLHPEEDDEIRRNQIDDNGEVGRDRV